VVSPAFFLDRSEAQICYVVSLAIFLIVRVAQISYVVSPAVFLNRSVTQISHVVSPAVFLNRFLQQQKQRPGALQERSRGREPRSDLEAMAKRQDRGLD
jgi:hypothetical protein